MSGFCEHALEPNCDPDTLARDASGIVCCPYCLRWCETCGTARYRGQMREVEGYFICNDCFEADPRERRKFYAAMLEKFMEAAHDSDD